MSEIWNKITNWNLDENNVLRVYKDDTLLFEIEDYQFISYDRVNEFIEDMLLYLDAVK